MDQTGAMPKVKDVEKESLYGYVHAINGPLVIAEQMTGCSMYELVRVGNKEFVGEIIKLSGDTATIQVYEDISLVAVGDPVLRTGKPLTVELGPGLLGRIFDGLQRPLEDISSLTNSFYLPPTIGIQPLNRNINWQFKPGNIQPGSKITGGDIYGIVYENSMLQHKLMLPPKCKGTVTWIADQDSYDLTEVVLETELDGQISQHTMMHEWPVRQSRQMVDMTVDEPLFTGQRALDAMFPCAKGGTAALAGASGCGKTVLCQALSKYSNSDIIVYVGCGERGNEMSHIVGNFPEVPMDDDRETVSAMKTVLVANTSNMPRSANEVSIYTGITLSEYFRDMGYNVSMVADSISHWAAALPNLKTDLPTDSGYPVYLASRLANFFQRAGKGKCIGDPIREGSVTIVNTVSPPGGDFADPVTTIANSTVDVFWSLDKIMAQRREFPSLDCLFSFSKSVGSLEEFYKENYSNFLSLRKKALDILQKWNELLDIIQLVSKSYLSDLDHVTVEAARQLKEDFLQQDLYTLHDRYCPFTKTVGMLNNILAFYDLSIHTVESTAKSESPITWAMIKDAMSGIVDKISLMKCMDPLSESEDKIKANLDNLHAEIVAEFKKLGR